LHVVDLTKRFGGLTAVNNISVDIFPGEVVAWSATMERQVDIDQDGFGCISQMVRDLLQW
jgi:hypothetical protein